VKKTKIIAGIAVWSTLTCQAFAEESNWNLLNAIPLAGPALNATIDTFAPDIKTRPGQWNLDGDRIDIGDKSVLQAQDGMLFVSMVGARFAYDPETGLAISNMVDSVSFVGIAKENMPRMLRVYIINDTTLWNLTRFLNNTENFALYKKYVKANTNGGDLKTASGMEQHIAEALGMQAQMSKFGEVIAGDVYVKTSKKLLNIMYEMFQSSGKLTFGQELTNSVAYLSFFAMQRVEQALAPMEIKWKYNSFFTKSRPIGREFPRDFKQELRGAEMLTMLKKLRDPQFVKHFAEVMRAMPADDQVVFTNTTFMPENMSLTGSDLAKLLQCFPTPTTQQKSTNRENERNIEEMRKSAMAGVSKAMANAVLRRPTPEFYNERQQRVADEFSKLRKTSYNGMVLDYVSDKLFTDDGLIYMLANVTKYTGYAEDKLDPKRVLKASFETFAVNGKREISPDINIKTWDYEGDAYGKTKDITLFPFVEATAKNLESFNNTYIKFVRNLTADELRKLVIAGVTGQGKPFAINYMTSIILTDSVSSEVHNLPVLWGLEKDPGLRIDKFIAIAVANGGKDFRPEFVSMVNAIVAGNSEEAITQLHKLVPDAVLAGIKKSTSQHAVKIANSVASTYFKKTHILIDSYIGKLLSEDQVPK